MSKASSETVMTGKSLSLGAPFSQGVDILQLMEVIESRCHEYAISENNNLYNKLDCAREDLDEILLALDEGHEWGVVRECTDAIMILLHMISHITQDPKDIKTSFERSLLRLK